MNFKELTKIPVPPAPQTDIPAEMTEFVNSGYSDGYNKTIKNFLYLAEIIEDILVVTVYHGGKFMWRTFITSADYCTQKAGNSKKSTAGVWRLTDYGQTYIPINGAGEIIKRYVDMYHKHDNMPRSSNYLEVGMAVIDALQWHIRQNKTVERHRKIREATEECMLEIRPPVKPFTEWLKNQSSSVYIIYNTRDGFGVCTHCLKKVEQGKDKWRHRGEKVCPHCRKRAVLLCSGRFRDGRIERHTEAFWYAQKTSDGCCARLFSADYILSKGGEYHSESSIPIIREWNMNISCSEVGRVFLDFKGNFIKSFVWGNFMQTGENYWCRTNNVYYSAAFYTGNLRQAFSNYQQLKYIPWDKVSKIVGKKIELFKIVKKLIDHPWIERLIKVRMNNLTYDYLYNDYFVKNINASDFVNGTATKSLAHILGLNRRELRDIMPYDPSSQELDLYKLLLHHRAGIEEWKILRYFPNYLNDISFALEYQPVSRYLRYIKEQEKLYIQHDYSGGIRSVINDYADYLQEAKNANYNMEDTATINPKSLIAAHTDSEIDSRIEHYKRTYAQYADAMAIAAQNVAKVEGITYEDERYRIAPIMSWEELLNESRCLRHCVASYAEKYANGYSIIFGIRNIGTPDTPFYTLELSGDFQNVRQCRGFKNHDAPENIMEVVRKWHKNLIDKNIKKAG